MGYFDYVYVTAKNGLEHALLETLRPRVAKFYGDYVLRTRRGSGWVQIELLGHQYERDLDFGEMMELCRRYPDRKAPAEPEQCLALSRMLGVDVVRVNAVTSVSQVEYTRCRNGEVVRHFQYSPQDDRFKGGWGEEVGSPEPWEQPHGAGVYIDVGDIGRSLGLPGLQRANIPGEGPSPFDREATVDGDRMAVPSDIEPAEIEEKWDLNGRETLSSPLLLSSLGALATWVVLRRHRFFSER